MLAHQAVTNVNINGSFSGPAGCLGCLSAVAVPVLILWALKRKLFGMRQPAVPRLWKQDEQTPVKQLDDLFSHDSSFTALDFCSKVQNAFELLTTHHPDTDLRWIASSELVGARGKLPRKAITHQIRILSATSENGVEQIHALLSGYATHWILWWSRWEEQWTFVRKVPQHEVTPGDSVCEVCGAPLEPSPEGTCKYCGSPAPGVIGRWRVVGREVMEAGLFR